MDLNLGPDTFEPFVDFDAAVARGPPGSAAAAARAASGLSLLGRVPLLAWVLLGCVILFAVSFYVYYTRRKGTTKNREAEELEALRKQLAEAREDIDALIQQHSAMAGTLRTTTSQLRGVNELARSVEQGLAEALDSWSQTVQELRSEFEVVAVDADEVGAAGMMQQQEQGEAEQEQELAGGEASLE
jgi:hypothetical protein